MEIAQRQILSPESLAFLGIDTMFYRTEDGITAIVQPLYIEPLALTVFAGAKLQPQGFLCITMKDRTDYCIQVRTEKLSNDTYADCWNIIFLEPLPYTLTDKIKELNAIDKESGKRSEERYEINTANAKKFGMKTPVCTLACGTRTVRCVIANASVHGALLTGERSFITVGSPVTFRCSFILGYVAQNAVIVSIRNAGNTTDYYSYALHFIEPLSLVWKQKIIAYRTSL